MKPATLLRLYPRQWRQRYGDEFVALLQQTGVGWRQVIDVTAAASREWVMTLVRWPALQAVANQSRRGLGFFAIGWIATALRGQTSGWLTDRRIELGSQTVQLQMVGLFLASALLCGCIERLAFRFVLRGRATSGELIFLNVTAYLAVTIAVFAAQHWLPGASLLNGIDDLNFFVMQGEFFGRPTHINPAVTHDAGVRA